MAQSNSIDSQASRWRLPTLVAAALVALAVATPPVWAQGSVGALSVSKMIIKLNFAKPDSDKIGVKGLLDVPADVAVEGLRVIVDVGGVVKTFTLDAKGKSKSGGDAFALKKPKSGASKFALKLIKGSFSASLADEGLADITVADLPVTVTVALTVNDNPAALTVPVQLSYTAKAGKTGKTK